MRKLSSGTGRKTEEAELNMSPLIDMIFILLIFFLVTTTFVKESGVKVTRPVAATTVAKEETNLVIGITKEGMVWIENQPIDILSVRPRMERFKLENPDGNVVITADKDCNFGIAIDVFDQVKQAQIKDVVIAATKE